MEKKGLLLVFFLALSSIYASSVTVTHVDGSPSLPKVLVHPASIINSSLVANTYFTININVTNVTNLWSYDFYIWWNPSLLDYTTLVEGPFLKQGGSTQFFSRKNQTMGWIYATSTLLGQPFIDSWPVSGSGTLATITFKVEKLGSTALHLNGTVLRDDSLSKMDHTSEDGWFSNIGETPVHDLAITSVAAAPSPVCIGDSVTVNVDLKNEGNQYEANIMVHAYYDTNLIGEQTVSSLAPSAPITVSFTWTTATVGTYTISAHVTPVTGETDTVDNTKTDGTVNVRIRGDLDGDGYVGPIDLNMFAAAYGKRAGQTGYNLLADLDKDDYIGPIDLNIFAANYGKRA